MKSVVESIAPYGLTSDKIPSSGIWRAKEGDFVCAVVGVILAKHLFYALPNYKLGRKKYKDEDIIVLASCLTEVPPSLYEEDYISSIATIPLRNFENNYREDVGARFVSGGLASALASMYI